MREETRRKLERQLWMQRLKWIGGGLAAALVMGAGFWFTGLDASVETKHVPGIVQHVGPVNGTNTSSIENGLSVDVQLDDGRMAHVTVLREHEPHVGEHVEIAEHIHGTGRTTFSWK